MTEGEGSQSREPAGAGEPSRKPRWETWDRAPKGEHPGESYARLARYVSPATLLDLELGRGVGRPYDRDDRDADLTVAEGLYERIRERGIDYAVEPWVPERGQQIRDPRWILKEGWATCVDVAATYAALCLEAKVGVLLAVKGSHAFVALTPGRLHSPELSEFAIGPMERKPKGVLAGDSAALADAIDRGRVVAVDCFRAARSERPPASFAEAVAEGDAYTREGGCIWLVDVPWLHRNGYPPFSEPSEERIHRYVHPTKVAFHPYQSHVDAIAALEQATGRVVLYAPAGRGKSTVAREVALREPFGAGWFLNAADQQALIASLADAALVEQNRRGGSLPDADRRDHALSAIGTLERAEGRWIVVLDNADGAPKEIQRWTPRPDPRQDQLLIVTTTNPQWEGIPGYSFLMLKPITPDEIREVLGDNTLVELVQGRPLLVDAFLRLRQNGKWEPDATLYDVPRIARLEPELRGAAVLWAAVRRLDGFDERALRVAALAAYLPPDHQPYDVFDAAVEGGSRPTVDVLVSVGILTPDEDDVLVRMHRLVGAAVRADLDDPNPGLGDEMAALVVNDERARRALRDRGDLDTMRLLESRLTDKRLTRVVDEQTGITLHALATLLELHGHTRRSGAVFDLALPHLDGRPDLAADCFHGKARTVNQHHADDVPLVEEALGWAQTAERLMNEAGKPDDAARCYAMQGLLTQKLGKKRDGEEGLTLLKGARRIIDEADKRRRASTTRTPEELARSRFNLAGIRIELAKKESEHARDHLDAARGVYVEVRDRRREIYRRSIHPHIAACEIGLGYVAYYEALLVSPHDDLGRTALLRDATSQALVAIGMREGEEGQIDGDETVKCLQFLAKVMLARRATAAVEKRAIAPVMREVERELIDAGLLANP